MFCRPADALLHQLEDAVAEALDARLDRRARRRRAAGGPGPSSGSTSSRRTAAHGSLRAASSGSSVLKYFEVEDVVDHLDVAARDARPPGASARRAPRGADLLRYAIVAPLRPQKVQCIRSPHQQPREVSTKTLGCHVRPKRLRPNCAKKSLKSGYGSASRSLTAGAVGAGAEPRESGDRALRVMTPCSPSSGSPRITRAASSANT